HEGMGKKHASQYANFGSLQSIPLSICSKQTKLICMNSSKIGAGEKRNVFLFFASLCYYLYQPDNCK
ncbi:MAG: hypothetical protein ACLRLK_23110, partial [Bacteroides thetaiotaomicron]